MSRVFCFTAQQVRLFILLKFYILLGTGKTLLAKTIAKMLNCEDIKRISASEVLSKWVGEAEQRVRELFVEAGK